MFFYKKKSTCLGFEQHDCYVHKMLHKSTVVRTSKSIQKIVLNSETIFDF